MWGFPGWPIWHSYRGPILERRLGIPEDSFSAPQHILLWICRVNFHSSWESPSLPILWGLLFISPITPAGNRPFLFAPWRLFPQEDACPPLTSSPVIHYSGKSILYSACSTFTSQVTWVLLMFNACIFTCFSQILSGCSFSDLGLCGSHHPSLQSCVIFLAPGYPLWLTSPYSCFRFSQLQ